MDEASESQIVRPDALVTAPSGKGPPLPPSTATLQITIFVTRRQL